jgi:hypothetical protein
MSLRLVDLNPHWISEWTPPDGALTRHGQGVMFDCPHCVRAGIKSSESRMVRIPVGFKNPIDGGPPFKDEIKADGQARGRPLWDRTGDTFETLTLSPSIDASKTHEGGWHGFVQNGAIVG